MIELGSREFWEMLIRDPGMLAFQLCSVDLVNLDATLQHHAATRAWVGAAFESAKIEEEKAKWELDKSRALALIEAKGANDSITGKPKTVQVLEAEVELDKRVIASTDALYLTQQRRGALKAIVEGLEDRKFMLIQIAANQRQEERNYNS